MHAQNSGKAQALRSFWLRVFGAQKKAEQYVSPKGHISQIQSGYAEQMVLKHVLSGNPCLGVAVCDTGLNVS